MFARAHVIALLSAAAWSGAGCGAPGAIVAEQLMAPDGDSPPDRLALTAPLFVAGEVMEFDLSLRGVVGGTVTISAGTPGTIDGQRVIVVKSLLGSAGVAQMVRHVRDDVTSWIDLATSTPIRSHAVLEYGDRVTSVDSAFFPGRVKVEFARGPLRGRRLQRLPPDEMALDAHSAMGALRAWEPRLGARVTFHIMSGRWLWHNDLRFVARENLRTPMGLYPAMRFEGVARRMTTHLTPDPKKQPRPYQMWFSDDLNRLPLRVTTRTEYGAVEAKLVRYQRPERFLRAQ